MVQVKKPFFKMNHLNLQIKIMKTLEPVQEKPLTKWFFKGQKEIKDFLELTFDDYKCIDQQINNETVFEKYIVTKLKPIKSYEILIAEIRKTEYTIQCYEVNYYKGI